MNTKDLYPALLPLLPSPLQGAQCLLPLPLTPTGLFFCLLNTQTTELDGLLADWRSLGYRMDGGLPCLGSTRLCQEQ